MAIPRFDEHRDACPRCAGRDDWGENPAFPQSASVLLVKALGGGWDFSSIPSLPSPKIRLGKGPFEATG
jgi:hypothetical protein